MTKIIIFTDFDGTLTRQPGLTTVESPFYKSLFVNGLTKQGDYLTADLKKSEEIQKLFKKRFEVYEEGSEVMKKADERPENKMLITPGAIAFFRNMLQSSDIAIYIVTKNRADYIRELLKYQGFSIDELAQIQIFDSCDKRNDVRSILSSQEPKADFLFFMEDSQSDCQSMVSGAKSRGYSVEQMRQYVTLPGTFKWDEYQAEIEELFLNAANERQQNNTNLNFFKGNIESKALTNPESDNQDSDLKKPEIK